MFEPLKVARVIDTTVPAVDKNGNISKLIIISIVLHFSLVWGEIGNLVDMFCRVHF